jgi:hypothetical protein
MNSALVRPSFDSAGQRLGLGLGSGQVVDNDESDDIALAESA